MTTLNFLQKNRGDILNIAQKHGVISLRVFGSVVRNEETISSDIDFLVATGEHVSAWFPSGLILELEALLGKQVDVVTETGLNPLLRETVLKEAIEL